MICNHMKLISEISNAKVKWKRVKIVKNNL
jgi:hypothetical protein